jgi:hypothetical protein
MSAGYYKRRRGILDHIEAGTIDLLESGIHDYLLLRANLVIGSACTLPAGVCLTSAPAIHAHCRRVSERTVQRILDHLEKIDFIKTFKTPGKRGNYPALLCRGSVHDLSGKEFRVNGAKTVDWRFPVYEPVGEVSGKLSNSGGTLAGYREVESREERESQKIESTAPASQAPTSHPFFEIWNQNRGQLAEARSLGKGRLAKCRLRARDLGEERFLEAVCKAAATPFCLGLNDRGWKADFDWLIANDTNAAKVLEGKYDGQPQEPVWRQKQKFEEQQKAEAIARFAKDDD